MTLHSITATYPGFQALPKGVKKMLFVSESMFFDEARVEQKDTHTGQRHPQDVHVQNDAYHIAPYGANGPAPLTGIRAG
jgi:hypothetical protein